MPIVQKYTPAQVAEFIKAGVELFGAITGPGGAGRARVYDLLKTGGGGGWVFAKSMPDNPHEYTLRDRWANPAEFYAVVLYLRTFGQFEWWPDPVVGRCYVYLDFDLMHHWTMGDPLRTTWLINRKSLDPANPTRPPAPQPVET